MSNHTDHSHPDWPTLPDDAHSTPRCCSMHDPDGRRGIWYHLEGRTFRLVAGREGYDAEVVIRVGETVTPEMLAALCGALDYGAWMQEDHGPNAMFPERHFPGHTNEDG